MIDSMFMNINGLFAPSFKNGDDVPTRNSFNEYYVPLIKKPFSERPIKDKQEVDGKLAEMSRSNDYTSGNLLDYLHHQNYCNLIGIDLSRETSITIT